MRNFCPECGKRLLGNEAFCPECGKNLMPVAVQTYTESRSDNYGEIARRIESYRDDYLRKGRGTGIASLILGGVSLLLVIAMLAYNGRSSGLEVILPALIFSPPGLILGIISKCRHGGTIAMIGLILSSAALAIGIFWVLIVPVIIFFGVIWILSLQR